MIQTPTDPTDLTDEQVQEILKSGQGKINADAGGPPIEMSDEEVTAILANKEGVLNAGTTRPATTPTSSTSQPGFMDRPLPGITSNIGLTPRHITRGLSAAGNAIVGTAKTAYDIASDPLNMLLPGAGAIHHALVNPALDQARQSSTAASEGRTSEAVGHGLAAVVPVAGPAAARLGEQIGTGQIPEAVGEFGAGMLIGKGIEAAPGLARGASSLITGRPPRLPVTPTKNNIYNLAAVSRSNTPEIVEVIGPLKTYAQEVGIDPNLISVKDLSPKTSLIGDLERGYPEAEFNALAKKLGVDPKRMAPIPIKSAVGAVDVTNRPFKLAMDTYGKFPSPEIQTNIEGQLKQAMENSIDDGVKKAYGMVLKRVEQEGSTLGGLNRVKEWANKETERFYKLTPGGRINADAKPVIAFVDVANKVREQMYPRLTTLSKGRLDLADAGRIEAQAIRFRDNIFKAWDDAATSHASEVAIEQNKTMMDRARGMLHGVNPLTKNKLGMAQAVASNVAGSGTPLSLVQFNTLFKNGLGGVEGWVPQPLPTQLLTEVMAEQIRQAAEQNRGRLLPAGSPPGPMQGPPAPPRVSIAGGPVTGQGAQVRGVNAPVAGQLPMQPSSLDFGSGRVPVTPNQQFSGEASTSPLMKPSGPGTMFTRDPKVAASTLKAIDQILQNKQLRPEYRQELINARQKLMQQMQLQPPPTQ